MPVRVQCRQPDSRLIWGYGRKCCEQNSPGKVWTCGGGAVYTGFTTPKFSSSNVRQQQKQNNPIVNPRSSEQMKTSPIRASWMHHTTKFPNQIFFLLSKTFISKLVYSNFWTFVSILPIRSIRWLKWLAYPTSKLSKAYTKLQSSGAFRVFIKASNIWKNNLTKDSNCGNELFLPSAPRQVIDVTKPKNPATSPLSRNFRKCFTKVRSNLTR